MVTSRALNDCFDKFIHIFECIWKADKNWAKFQTRVANRMSYTACHRPIRDMRIIHLFCSNGICDRPHFSDMNKIQLEKVSLKKSFCKKKMAGLIRELNPGHSHPKRISYH